MERYILIVLVGWWLASVSSKTDFSNSWKIVGGRDAGEGEFPYQVSLLWLGKHTCGGSIVNETWVITAAHCVRFTLPEMVSVRVGSTKVNTGGIVYQAQKILIHPDYDSATGLNDAAIVQVDPIEFNTNVQPIGIEKKDIESNVAVVLSGWGTKSLWGPTPVQLQTIQLFTIDIKECSASHTIRPVRDTQVCTLTRAGEGACHGDSGGPLVTGSGNDRKLLGIVSWGAPCAQGKPDVYARATSYIDWFNNVCNCNL